jgi:hypothetical protein
MGAPITNFSMALFPLIATFPPLFEAAKENILMQLEPSKRDKTKQELEKITLDILPLTVTGKHRFPFIFQLPPTSPFPQTTIRRKYDNLFRTGVVSANCKLKCQ